MGYRKIILALIVSTVCCLSLYSQSLLKVDTSFSADYLVDKILVGKGIRVGNVVMKGEKRSICYFSIDTNIIGIKSGVLLSTGNVLNVARANSFPGISAIAWDYKIPYKSDIDLKKLCKGRVYDQIILEFDFVPFNNCLSFKFSFASEEYTEYVGSQFDDVFAFVLTGNGFKNTNLAVIPGTKEPISINNINQSKHSELFINNDYFFNYGVFKNNYSKFRVSLVKKIWNQLFNSKHNSEGFYTVQSKKDDLNQLIVSNLEYDGFTKVLSANCFLKPWQLYHLKIAIGDVGDKIFDSGVFIERGSFSSERDTTDPVFVEYPDLSLTMDWDSIFGWKKAKKVIIDTIPVIAEDFEITNVNFDFNKFDIPDSGKTLLSNLAVYLNKNPNYKIMLIGYTDNIGSKKYNKDLSEKRALSVMYYLTSKLVDRSRMDYLGYNYENPIADNNSGTGRAKNRRVEITLVEPSPKTSTKKTQ